MSDSQMVSLLSAFSPPEGLAGDFGWVCGFSGDGDFLDRAAEHFTGQSQGQRAYVGRVYLGVMLDPSAPQVIPTAAPGVLHLPARKVPLPFRLLHAKVALLSFSAKVGERWALRLIVCTGNWTRHTVSTSLDLVWTLELRSTELARGEVGQAVVDIRSAANFLAYVRALFATESLTDPVGAQVQLARDAMMHLDARVSGLPKRARGAPSSRFFDSRRKALLDQLPNLVRAVAGETRRNEIVIGSGFFGAGQVATEKPITAAKMLRSLQEGVVPLLTKSPYKTLVVNPLQCQEVATRRDELAQDCWRVIAARDPGGDLGQLRTLHAKFIISANSKSNGDSLTSPWLYLGSGNLTGPGFVTKAGPKGNLEAGVVLAPAVRTWPEVGKLLPFDITSSNLLDLPDCLAEGEGPPEPGDPFAAPPFAYVVLAESPSRLRPPAASEDDESVQVCGPDGEAASRTHDGDYLWPWAAPAEVRVTWAVGEDLRGAYVPVLDSLGRLAGKALPPIDLVDLETELRRFPEPPDDDHEEADVIDDEGAPGLAAPSTGGPHSESRYPIRHMMQAIEVIAAKQTSLDPSLWPAWCARLEQALVRMKGSTDVTAIRGLGINPLAVLRRPEFRPAFAEDGATAAGMSLDGVLDRVEVAWQFDTLVVLGGAP